MSKVCICYLSNTIPFQACLGNKNNFYSLLSTERHYIPSYCVTWLIKYILSIRNENHRYLQIRNMWNSYVALSKESVRASYQTPEVQNTFYNILAYYANSQCIAFNIQFIQNVSVINYSQALKWYMPHFNDLNYILWCLGICWVCKHQYYTRWVEIIFIRILTTKEC